MKKRVSCVIMAQILIVLIGTAVPALVHAWNQSFHALVEAIGFCREHAECQ